MVATKNKTNVEKAEQAAKEAIVPEPLQASAEVRNPPVTPGHDHWQSLKDVTPRGQVCFGCEQPPGRPFVECFEC